jgi:hypothetical protein
MSEGGGGGFLGAVGGIVAGIAGFLRGFFSITAKELLRLITFLKNGIIELSKQLLTGVFRLGRALARALRSLATLAVHGLRSLVRWVDTHLRALHAFLKDHLAGVLRFLKRIKDEVDKFYKTYIKPIIDTIEFIRAINAVLVKFHVTVLQGLDDLLAQVEQRIEAPLLWVRGKITWLENQIDRIVTLDGLFQKWTLITSMSRYAPAWLRIAVNARSRPVSNDGAAALQRAGEVQTQPALVDDLHAYLNGAQNDAGNVIDAAVGQLPAYWESFG